VVIGILLMLILAGVANATIKHGRVAARVAPSSALTIVHERGAATSVAWYCAGPLPLGQKGERASLVLANVSGTTITGEFSVATADGVIASRPVTVLGRTSQMIVLPTSPKVTTAAATVLAAGAGLAVSEEIRGPGGADISPCVNHATATQYLAGGSTTRPSGLEITLYDPGATPSVANVAFSTPSGIVRPPAYQGVPIAAGATATINVGQYLPSQSLVGTTVTSTGGPVVVGAVESALAGKTVLPSLVNAVAVAETAWWLAPAPSGTTTRQRFFVLNPGSRAASVTLKTVGDDGGASESVVVDPGSIATLAPAADASPGALRWAKVTASSPVVVARSTTIVGPAPTVRRSKGTKSVALTGAAALIAGLPTGYSLAHASPALARSWLVGDGESDAGEGEVLLIANPSPLPVDVSFTSLSGGAVPVAITIVAGGARVVSVPTNGVGNVVVVTAGQPIVVESGNYARGTKHPVGWSAPGAIVVE
jgi:hypothetical protein